MFNTSPETQIEIDVLASILESLPINGIASYDQLSEAVGYRVNDKPFALIKARKQIEERTGMRFGTVRMEGVKKLSSEAIAGIGADARKAIARKAKSQAKRLTGLRYNDIDGEKRARIDAERSLLGAIAATAKADVKKVETLTPTAPVVPLKIFEMMVQVQ